MNMEQSINHLNSAHNPYFSGLNDLLKEEGPGHPVMVIDLDILDHNLVALKKNMGDISRFRIVVKSLPCLNLIRYILASTKTRKAMVFHRPFLNLFIEAFPEANILLGKPLPVQAARTFYHQRGHSSRFDPVRNLQWLVDTHLRLLQYQQLAHDLGLKMQINIEIDVGLHRGGVPQPELLRPLLTAITDDPTHLSLAGFMGYDPHVAKSEKVSIPVAKAHSQILASYSGFIDFLKLEHPGLYSDSLTFNGAGSPTYALYGDEALLNDISVGSALVKPADFDLQSLSDHVPAMFIATPVLKKMSGVKIPFQEFLEPRPLEPKPSHIDTFFIYGGYWKALPMSPAGLVTNSLFGRSTNQEMLNGPAELDLEVDDYVFLRPTQSESVMLQFGDLFIVRGNKLIDRWPVFSPGS